MASADMLIKLDVHNDKWNILRPNNRVFCNNTLSCQIIKEKV